MRFGVNWCSDLAIDTYRLDDVSLRPVGGALIPSLVRRSYEKSKQKLEQQFYINKSFFQSLYYYVSAEPCGSHATDCNVV